MNFHHYISFGSSSCASFSNLVFDSLESFEEYSVQFSCSVMFDSLWPHELQHTRLSCPSPTPEACSHSCPLNWWCHPTISSSVVPFSSHLQFFPASGSFPMSQFFSSHGQSIRASLSASVLPMIYSAYKLNKQGDNMVLTYSFPNLEPVHCSTSGSNCCFLTCIQISQEAGKVVWSSHLLKNLPLCCDPHCQRL